MSFNALKTDTKKPRNNHALHKFVNKPGDYPFFNGIKIFRVTEKSCCPRRDIILVSL